MGAKNQDGVALQGLPLDDAAKRTTISGRDLPSGCPYDWVRVETTRDENVFRARVRSAFESWVIQVPVGEHAEAAGVTPLVQDPGGYEDEPLAEWVATLLETAGVEPGIDWMDLTAGGEA